MAMCVLVLVLSGLWVVGLLMLGCWLVLWCWCWCWWVVLNEHFDQATSPPRFLALLQLVCVGVCGGGGRGDGNVHVGECGMSMRLKVVEFKQQMPHSPVRHDWCIAAHCNKKLK
jgi:hypothetical protein